MRLPQTGRKQIQIGKELCKQTPDICIQCYRFLMSKSFPTQFVNPVMS